MALQWLRESCESCFGSTIFFISVLLSFLFKFFLKMLQNRRFSAWASGSGFGAAICVAVVRNYYVLQLSLSRPQRNGCAKVPRCCGCVRNTVALCS